MAEVGIPLQGLEWRRSRDFFYWRVKCRLLQKESAVDVTGTATYVSKWLEMAHPCRQIARIYG